MEDESGQFLLLTSVVVAVSLVVLLVFINQSSMSGYSSSESIMNFPKDNIRDFRAETINDVQHIASTENSWPVNVTTKQLWFNSNISSSIYNTKQLYAQRGVVVDVQYKTVYNDTATEPPYQKLINATLYMDYNDGETSYNETYVADFGWY
jgi:hypothetical protein